jgi:hypothetical protein
VYGGRVFRPAKLTPVSDSVAAPAPRHSDPALLEGPIDGYGRDFDRDAARKPKSRLRRFAGWIG